MNLSFSVTAVALLILFTSWRYYFYLLIDVPWMADETVGTWEALEGQKFLVVGFRWSCISELSAEHGRRRRV